MTYSAQFECVKGLRTGTNKEKFPTSFSFWEMLMRLFVGKSDSYRLECKFSDKEAIASASKYGARESAECHISDLYEIWEGVIDEHFIYELFIKPFDSEGKIKWHSVFLLSQTKVIMSVCMYGREYCAHGLTREEVETVRELLPPDYFTFCFWEERESGKEVEIESMLCDDGGLASILKKLTE